MTRHWTSLITLLVLLTTFVHGKEKKKILPAYVLRARTIVVVVDPEAGISPLDPNASRIAQQDVEKALVSWGRFTPVMDAQTADLVISIRRGNGKAVNPTVGGDPNNRPVRVQPNDSGGIRIGVQQGKNTPLNDPSAGTPPAPQPQTEIAPSEDMFSVYRGQVEYPLDSPPVWRYVAKDALRAPSVSAVEQSRKVIEETEKQLSQKKP
jgi:hypothetical protein